MLPGRARTTDVMTQDRMIRARTTSFIIRVWEDGDSASAVRGEIENVCTGEKRLFRDYPSLLTFLEVWHREAAG